MTKEDEAQRRGSREGTERTVDLGPWEVGMWWPLGSTAGPAELTIRAKPEADPRDVERGITTGTLRSIPLTEVTKEMRQLLRAADEVGGRLASAEAGVRAAVDYIIESAEADPNPGKRGRPEKFHLAVAVAYAWYAQWERKPTQVFAEAVRAERRTAENWVRLARENGMLTRSTPGQAGGTLTDRAEALLGQE